MGVRLEELYSNLHDHDLNDFSQMNVSISTKDCTLEATYSGKEYQKVHATQGDEKCKLYNYENGDRPGPLTDQLVDRDLERAYNRKLEL